MADEPNNQQERETQPQAITVEARRATSEAAPTDEAATQNRTLESLSAAERRILRVLTDPRNYGKTESERIELAKVSRCTYYRILRDPGFAQIERDLVRQTIRANIGAIVNKSVDVAVNHARDGFQDRRLLLEMSGHYEPRRQVEHSGAVAIVGVVGVDVSQV